MANKDYEFSSHGIKIHEYLGISGIPLWLKTLEYVLAWYLHPSHKNQVFFKKYSTICNDLQECGCMCTERGIEEAFRILKTPEEKGGLGLFNVVYAEMSKKEWKASEHNPKKWIYRKVYLNWAKIHKYYSVFSTHSKVFKELRSKSRLKKLVQKRSKSFTRNLQQVFEMSMKEANLERYTSARKMFYGFLYSVSRNYYDVTKLIQKFIPEHEIDLQKVQDAETWLEIVPSRLRGTPLDPLRNIAQKSQSNAKGQAPASLHAFYEAI